MFSTAFIQEHGEEDFDRYGLKSYRHRRISSNCTPEKSSSQISNFPLDLPHAPHFVMVFASIRFWIFLDEYEKNQE